MSFYIDNIPTKATTDHLDKIAQVYLASMQTDPMYVHMFEGIKNYEKYLLPFWKALVCYSIINGEVYTTKDINACASWLLPNKCEFTFWRMAKTGFLLLKSIIKFPPKARKKAQYLFSYLDKMQKSVVNESHIYLLALGVTPEMQGKGIGSELIQPVLKYADQNGFKCYLETETAINIKFYNKQGFSVAKKFVTPKYNLDFWTMVRYPIIK